MQSSYGRIRRRRVSVLTHMMLRRSAVHVFRFWIGEDKTWWDISSYTHILISVWIIDPKLLKVKYLCVFLWRTDTDSQLGRRSTGSHWRRWWFQGRWRTFPTLWRQRPQRWGSPGCFPLRCGSSTPPWWTHAWWQKTQQAMRISLHTAASIVNE